jgi:hypothetical protein
MNTEIKEAGAEDTTEKSSLLCKDKANEDPPCQDSLKF